jgi:5'-nucleotidase
VIDDRPVTSSASFGRVLTDIDMKLRRRTRDVRSVRVNNKIVRQTVKPALDLRRLVEHYRNLAAPLANRVIGWTNGPLRREQVVDESPLGNTIADAQLAATRNAAGAVVAFMNPGGIRANLNETAPPNTAADVTYGEAFTVQPFGNSLVTMDLTGAQVDTLLEQQWCAQAPGTARILSVSAGFTYTWDGAVPQATCEKVSNIAINGTPLNPAATYRVTVNSFLAGGGDGFAVLARRHEPHRRPARPRRVRGVPRRDLAGGAAAPAADEPHHACELGVMRAAAGIAPRPPRAPSFGG